MIEHSQEADIHPSSFSIEQTEFHPLTPSPETLNPPSPFFACDLFPSHQKIEITFAQGHRLCLEGSFDWNKLRTWLTPLLILEK
ncbi:MAG: hypothetical protein H0X26_10250 [Alphaproteobacteria bacterium]|nr:hypothetical protein [Alphaproteobacteria bacterium]